MRFQKNECRSTGKSDATGALGCQSRTITVNAKKRMSVVGPKQEKLDDEKDVPQEAFLNYSDR
jgi:hypothetical protein